jgi:hypothetical protein
VLIVLNPVRFRIALSINTMYYLGNSLVSRINSSSSRKGVYTSPCVKIITNFKRLGRILALLYMDLQKKIYC